MQHARHPLPLVGQRQALLPDGQLDPASQTDCGEACCSIVLEAFDLVSLSPGCIRQAMGKSADNGDTTGRDLADFLHSFRVDKAVESVAGAELAARLPLVETSGGCSIILGRFIFPSLNHWQVTGRCDRLGVWMADPWNMEHVYRTWEALAGDYAGELVVIHGR